MNKEEIAKEILDIMSEYPEYIEPVLGVNLAKLIAEWHLEQIKKAKREVLEEIDYAMRECVSANPKCCDVCSIVREIIKENE